MTQGTFLVPGPGGSFRISSLTSVLPKRPNRRRHTLLWRIVCFAAGVVIGWIISGMQ
jgi:hypothetical protein